MPDLPEKISPRTGSGTETLNWGHWTGADAAARPTIVWTCHEIFQEKVRTLIIS